jgi:hypothetical protein
MVFHASASSAKTNRLFLPSAAPTGIETAVRNFFANYNELNFEPFKAVFVIPREYKKNATQYLLHLITVRTTITSGYKPYRKALAIGWENFFQKSKKLTDEATSTEPILCGGYRESQAIYGGIC